MLGRGVIRRAAHWIPEDPESLLQPVMVLMVPATNPAIAAEMINVRAVRVISICLCGYWCVE